MLVCEEVEDPRFTYAEDVLVRIEYAALNPVDYKVMRTVTSKMLVRYPVIAGLDFSGVVEQIGSAVSRIKVGDKVFGKQNFFRTCREHSGSLAKKIMVKHTQIAVVGNLTAEMPQMAGLGVAGMSAWASALYQKSRTRDSRILINGASGGVGHLAVQIAKAHGAHVTGICSTKNMEYVKKLGADDVIDYTVGDVVEYLAGSHQTTPFDLVIDCVGNSTLFYQAHRFTQPSATVVCVAGDSSVKDILGTATKAMLPAFMGGGRRSFLQYALKDDPDILDSLQGLIAQKKLSVNIQKIYDFTQVPQAFVDLMKGHVRGKLVIKVAEE